MACALAAVLMALALPATSKISGYNARVRSISNLRQIGVAARLYANDHDQQLPGQPTATGSAHADQWPALLCAYLSPINPTVFLDPGNPATSRLASAEILSNRINNTGFIYNGFDELSAGAQPPMSVPLNLLPSQTETVLLAQKKPGAKPFCLDPVFHAVGSLLDYLDPGAYDGGAHYLFVDGSVRYVKWTDYSNNFWLVDKQSKSPLPPLPPMTQSVRGDVRYAGRAARSLPLATIR